MGVCCLKIILLYLINIELGSKKNQWPKEQDRARLYFGNPIIQQFFTLIPNKNFVV